jgi:hypothetical protein
MKPLQQASLGIVLAATSGRLAGTPGCGNQRLPPASRGAALPAAVVLPPLVGLAGLVLILAALIVVETTRYGRIRRNLRGAESPASS